MRKVITSLLFVLVAIMLTAAPIGAGRAWCRADPIISFNGTPVQVWVEIPEQYEYLVNGPIEFDVTTPGDVESEVVFTDDGFNGQGERVEFMKRRDVHSRNNSTRSTTRQANEIFTVKYEIRVPIDADRLEKDFGRLGNTIPMRVRIIDAYGDEKVVRGSSAKATISVAVKGGK